MTLLLVFGLLFPSQVPEYSITCDQAQFENMMENWEQEITIPCTVTHQGIIHENCTMRIRGDTSRAYRKKSYRVEFPPDQPLHGRTTWNFNAEYADRSYMRAWLFSRVLESMGFPVFRVSHARLNVNGDYRGLFILLEPVDEAFLSRSGIDPSGNLYKAQVDGACANIHDDVDSVWSLKTGSGTGMNDLIQLIEDLEYTAPGNFQAFMDTAFVMEGEYGLLRMLAINSAFANNSTYYHNYYLYHDAAGSGRWIMLPWDVDKVLSDNLGISYGGCTNLNWYDNPIHARTLTVPDFREAFQDSVEVIYQEYLTPENLLLWSDSLEAVLQQAVEEDDWDDTDLQGFQGALEELRENLDSRTSDLQWQFQYKFFPFRSYRSDTLATDSLPVSWAPTVDPLGNPASYTVIVRDSLGPDADEITRFEGIQDSVFTITGIPPGSWWWTVETNLQAGWRRTEATDRYNPFRIVEPVELEGVLGENTFLRRSNSPYLITGELVVPGGVTLSAEPGVVILMGEQGAISCQGEISLQGNAQDSVFISAVHGETGWRGIRVQNGGLEMANTVVSGSRGYSSSPGEGFAALAGTDAQITITGSVFRNNWCSVKLHGGTAEVTDSRFVHCRGEMFYMEQGESASIVSTVFHDLYDPVAGSMDGIEFQLCRNGIFTVEDCQVSSIDGDCIDMNASTVTVSGTTISNSSDKGISIGAPTGGSGSGTMVTVTGSIIENCPMGIAVKDGAFLQGSGLLLRNCETGISVYEKTPGAGGGHGETSSSIFQGCGSPVSVEEGTLSVDWSISDTQPLTGQGNIQGDPRTDEVGYLLWNSPCIDGGDPEEQDPDGTRQDIGPFFYPSAMPYLCVNEIMAKNDTVILDDWGRTSDWIELYNGNPYEIDAGVLVFMNADSAGADPWSVPRGTMIPPGGFLLFWADGDGWKGGTHLPFRLSAGGDGFILGRIPAGDGEEPFVSMLEDVSFGDQTADISWGRFPDGGEWRILQVPTPGWSNGNMHSQPVYLCQPRPNPCSTGSVTVEVEIAGGQTDVFVYDLAGRRVETLHQGYLPPGSSTFFWNTGTAPSGVYLVFARCAGQTPASAKITVLR